MNTLISIAFTFFLVANPVGNAPAVLALVKDLPFERQKKVLLREALIAFLIAIFFQFCGRTFLGALAINQYAVTICGGIMLLIVALRMIFPADSQQAAKLKQEPLIVPIATPLVSGPALLTIIMLYAQQENDSLKIIGAISLAWIGVILVLWGAPYLQKVLGRRGMIALEQLMGMSLSMISTGMIAKGFGMFLTAMKLGVR